jgi:hypothetical protein
MAMFLDGLPVLHISVEHSWMIKPAESHHVFGAGFLLIGALLAVEGLAGGVWHENKLRSMMFPMVLGVMGAGLLAVTVIEPNARIAHFAMGMPLALGGWAEARHRDGLMTRRYADVLIGAGLLFAAVETGMFHLGGDQASGVFLSHVGLIVMAITLVGLRFYQGMKPASLPRALLIAGAIAVVGMILFTDAQFQRSGSGGQSSVAEASLGE